MNTAETLKKQYNETNEKYYELVAKPAMAWLKKIEFSELNYNTWIKTDGPFIISISFPRDLSYEFRYIISIDYNDNDDSNVLLEYFDTLEELEKFYTNYKLPEIQQFELKIPIRGVTKEMAVSEFLSSVDQYSDRFVDYLTQFVDDKPL